MVQQTLSSSGEKEMDALTENNVSLLLTAVSILISDS